MMPMRLRSPGELRLFSLATGNQLSLCIGSVLSLRHDRAVQKCRHTKTALVRGLGCD